MLFRSTDKKELKVEFAPGCFDDFDGTQEELQDLIAHIRQMASDGTIFDDSVQLTSEEEEAVWKMLADKQKEKRQ